MAPIDRRDFLRSAGGALIAGSGAFSRAGQAEPARGRVIGHPVAAKTGEDILAAGGNAVDAAVAAAFVAAVVAPHLCGIGGYGGHLTVATADGGKVTSIDFNSTAPAAARADMFPLEPSGAVKDRINAHGWLAAGVPGTLAGLQLACDRFGAMSLAKVLEPAIRFASEGYEVSTSLANAARSNRSNLAKDPGSARLYLESGEPLQQGAKHRNPDLARLLQTLADRKSVDSFYRGDIARQIADAFRKNGGLVTAADLAAYQAREVQPLQIDWRGHVIATAPLTAGGVSVLQAIRVLDALKWERRDADDPATSHARLEALRLAWHDRLRLLGDPEKAEVPWQKLLSTDYARALAAKVDAAVKEGRPIPFGGDGRPAGGTVHLSAVDAKGMMAALTLTQGNSFGAQITVEGLGLTLGHGMSRFEPQPGHPNSPGPGKRPLHNMCPTIVLRDGKPVLALGGAGGRKIPNSVFDVLMAFVGRDAPLPGALAGPRWHTEGDTTLFLSQGWPDAHTAYFKRIGYDVRTAGGALISAVARDPGTGEIQAGSR